jgi:hypothetical protein
MTQEAVAATPASGSPEVCAAFRLGWTVGRLYTRALPKSPQPRKVPPSKLPAGRDLRGTELIRRDLAQIAATLRMLDKASAGSGVALPAADTAADAFERLHEDESGEDRFRLAVVDLHIGLLRDLGAADFRLGKAYDVGRALADMTRLPAGHRLERLKPDLEKAAEPPDRDLREVWLLREFGEYRTATIMGKLDDLGSAFPEHAGRAVSKSIAAFARPLRDEIEAHGPAFDWRQVETILQRQGEVWRTLLSGEKVGRDMLGPLDYVRVAAGWMRETRTLARDYARLFWLAIAVAVLLAAGGIVLAAAGTDEGASIAGIAAVITSLAVSLKGASATLGRAGEQLARPLWQLEVEDVLAAVITASVPHRGGDRPA